MKHFGYFLAAGVLVVFAVFGGASEARACTSLGTPTMSPSNPSAPAPINATLSFNISGCTGGEEIELRFSIGPTTLATRTTTVPSGVTGTETLEYEFTAGDDSACFNGSCPLSAQVRILGTSVPPEAANITYSCADINCGGTGSTFGPFRPSWTSAPNDNDGGGTGITGEQSSFARLQNPIAYDNIPDVIRQLITIVFIIGVPLVALAIIYAGFLLVTAGGDQNKLTKGKQALLAGVLGGAILLGAWVIAEAIQGTVDQIRGV